MRFLNTHCTWQVFFLSEMSGNSLIYLEIFPEEPNRATKLNILIKHLYCTSKARDQDKPVITILFSAIQCIIDAHEKQHSYLEISHDIKKHQHEVEDFYNKSLLWKLIV